MNIPGITDEETPRDYGHGSFVSRGRKPSYTHSESGEQPVSVKAAKPAAADRGGRPAEPMAQVQPQQQGAFTLPPAVNRRALLMKQFGKYPSMGRAGGPTPDILDGQPNFNPFTGRWM